MNPKKLKTISKIIALVPTTGLIIYIILANLAPFDVTRHLVGGTAGLSALGPASRVQIMGNITKQIDSLIYLTSQMAYQFERGELKLALKNTSPSQEVLVGFQDQDTWHYQTKVASAPFIDAITWPRLGQGPYLYQKGTAFKTVQDFLANPPKTESIGVYDYDAEKLKQDVVTIPDYKPQATDTVIAAPLRGRVTMYAYLNNEPFDLKIEKRDLNWYKDPDAVDVKIYKQNDPVLGATIDDDGNTSGNHQVGRTQGIELKNPGPGLPESGVYKIVISASDDTIITKITTNLHKLVFEGPLSLVSNHEVYGAIAPQTTPSSLYIGANNISVRTFHQTEQILSVNGKPMPLTRQQPSLSLGSDTSMVALIAPKSDIVVSGVGYFAFSQDQFFQPTPYHILQITSPDDLAKVDYVLTDYTPPKKLADGWVQIDQTFDLHHAVTQKGKLSWIISAPGLKDNNRTIEIKDIEMTLSKKGWFK